MIGDLLASRRLDASAPLRCALGSSPVSDTEADVDVVVAGHTIPVCHRCQSVCVSDDE